MALCRPPHVIVSESRNFAVFSDKFLVVPPRQIGIFSSKKDADLLKAISLYLSSDFVFYHQFLTSTHFGVQRGLATLGSLRGLPMPFSSENGRQVLKKWIELHFQLILTPPSQLRELRPEHSVQLFADGSSDTGRLVHELNEVVNDALGLSDRERALVHDLVHVKLDLNQGKCGHLAVISPTVDQMRAYGKRLKSELDKFLGDEASTWHQVAVMYERRTGMIQVDLLPHREDAVQIKVLQADNKIARQLVRMRDRLRKQFAQWVNSVRHGKCSPGPRAFFGFSPDFAQFGMKAAA